jgi:hypothetical protein
LPIYVDKVLCKTVRVIGKDGPLQDLQQPLENRSKIDEALDQQFACLNLVTNAVVVFNTVHITKVAEELRREGHEVSDEDLARLWPSRFGHIVRRFTRRQIPFGERRGPVRNLWVNGSPNDESQRGQEHAVKASEHLKVLRMWPRKTRVIGRELDCPNPSFQRWNASILRRQRLKAEPPRYGDVDVVVRTYCLVGGD